MKIFFLAVVLIYGGIHTYAFYRVRAALSLQTPAGIILAVFMVIMTAGPFLVRVLEQREYELAARSFAGITYFWMGLIFLFFCFSLLMEASNIILKLAGSVTGGSLNLPAKYWLPAVSCLALAVCIGGYMSALQITTERMEIQTAKLPAGIDRFRIVQISDVHLGLVVRGGRLKRIVDTVKSEKPQMIVSTGDLVDAQINHLNGLAEMLRGIEAPYGKYAVIGNHEFYAGLKQATEFIESAGFRLLRNEAENHPVIHIAGVDDPSASRDARPRFSEASLLPRYSRDKFTILLKHRPSLDETAAGMFDLQLSGHTHKGQIFPFNYVVQRVYPFIAGTFRAKKGSLLHVSRGTGTWGPPVRILSPPEITVIDLVRKGE